MTEMEKQDLLYVLERNAQKDQHGYHTIQQGNSLKRLFHRAWQTIKDDEEELNVLRRNPRRFITCYEATDIATQYDAGRVYFTDGMYCISKEASGARDTFSIGQPVYDEDGNIMGYLGIGILNNLDYSAKDGLRIPVEIWQICLPTKFCRTGKQVYTYWQQIERNQE